MRSRALLLSSALLLPAIADEIHDAARAGNLATVQALLEKDLSLHGAKDASGATPLHYACASGRKNVVAYLLEKMAVVDTRDALGRSPLWLCADRNQSLEIAEMLLAKGADPNATGPGLGARSPFAVAISRGSAPLVDLLLARGAKLPALDDPIIPWLVTQATQKGLVQIMKGLVALGVDLRTQDAQGSTLLHHAAAGGSKGILEILLKAKLSVNAENGIGWTPLHYAAEAGQLEIVETLIARGAALDARTRDGRSALNLAQEWGKTEVVERLAAKGAQRDGPRFPLLEGAYLGQKTPGAIPESFAPGLVVARYPLYGGVCFSPDGASVYWSLMNFGGRMAILESKRVRDRWTFPQVVSFQAPGLSASSPFPSPDGRKLFFHSNAPLEKGGTKGKTNLWVMERKGTEWSEPLPLSPVINALPLHWAFSVDLKGNLYFGANRQAPRQMEQELFWSRYENGTYTPPERFGPEVNGPGSTFAPFIAPDGGYLLVTQLQPGADRPSLHLSFRRLDGTWTPARDIKEELGAQSAGSSPWVSPDGKYLFFRDTDGPRWMEASFIERLRRVELQRLQ